MFLSDWYILQKLVIYSVHHVDYLVVMILNLILMKVLMIKCFGTSDFLLTIKNI